jgi:quercetin dioxygenase-like cupin family protein
VQSFGIQVFDMPPNADRYPEHDHSHDGQEEVYTVLEGAATLTAGGEDHEMRPGMWARVGPGERRKWTTGEESARVLALGAVPGKAYEVQEFTNPQGEQAG